MTPATIRAAVKDDLADVRACLVETWHATYDAIYGADEVTRITDSWHAVAVLRGQLADSTNTFLVAEHTGRIVGTALLQVTTSDLAVLQRLYMRPANQGQSIGAGLLAASLRAVPSDARVRLEVARANVRAIAFYARHGFLRAGLNADGATLVYEKLG
jgi:ribosomal protein S18 acetylase RimI-like enzyme